MPRAPDFDLAIIPAGTGYTVQIQVAFGVGELRPQSFAPPLDLTALPRLRRGMDEWVKQARVTRLAGSEELRQARVFGGALFERLFTGEVLASFRASRAALPPGEGLRVRLRLPDRLTPLPWELIYDQRDNQFLALAPDLALIRYPEMPTPITPLRMGEPVQVVAVLARPHSQDYPPSQLDRELRRIEAALETPLSALPGLLRPAAPLHELAYVLSPGARLLSEICNNRVQACNQN
jgi:hypothetical protein